MKRAISLIALTGIVFAAGAGSAWLWMQRQHQESVVDASAAPQSARTWYTCGMHPEVVQDHPGDCPKCGMKLQPMAADRAAAMGLSQPAASPPIKRTEAAAPERKTLYWKSSMIPGETHSEPGKDSMGMDLVPVYADEASAGTIRIDPVIEQNMGVRVDKVIRAPLNKSIRTLGNVAYDETTLAAVATKVGGWIEKLYVDQTGQQVHKGDPLFDLYSPELFSAQQEYVAALRNEQTADLPLIPRSRIDSQALVRDARTRLEFFDISPEQIAQLKKSGEVTKTLSIRAPFTGIVTQKNVVEGQKIAAGTDVFKLADISNVWVIAQVYESDAPYVKLGQEALMTLTYLPGRTFRGRVTYVYPYLEAKTRTVPVRMEFHNPGYELKPGMYATVSLVSQVAAEATMVPDMAVIRTGMRAVAFVMPRPGHFEPRELKIGARDDNNYLQVLSGLSPGETVVISGQFLLDSESRLREAAVKFMEPGTVGGAQPIKDATRQSGAAAPPPGEGELFYVCPMPEHSDILYDKPGRCPICGMQLVPVRKRGGHVEKPKIAYWTCPMPEHSSVHRPGPGKCPICGMSLIPVPESQVEKTPAAGGRE